MTRTWLLLPLLGGCVINSEKWPRPRDLAPAWLVDRPRLLALQAEPPEARPGDVVTFSALLAQPPGAEEDLVTVWLACPLGEDVGCATDLGEVGTTTDPYALADLGVIGFEPGLPPVYVVPLDLLDELSPEARIEGLQVLVQSTSLPAELLEDPEALEDLDFSVVEAGYKRLVVSEALTPNHNPRVGGYTVDGEVVPEGAVVHLDPGQVYEVGVQLPEDAVEDYVFVNSEGIEEQRVEEPYVAWFASGGDLLESVTLFPYLEASWTSPAAPGATGAWYAVLRDRRGGMAWKVQEWVVDER